MNKKAYDGLSAEHKKIVDETSGEALSVKAAGIYKKAGAGSLAGEKKSGRGEVHHALGRRGQTVSARP